MSRYPLAIEFRTGSWLNDEHRQETLRFLREQQLSLVCVDEPQGLASSVLPLAEVTVSPGLVRFHGRNKKNWESHNLTVRDKYEYLYTEEELLEWVPKIRLMADLSSVVYVIFKNKHCDFAVRNARQMKILLG